MKLMCLTPSGYQYQHLNRQVILYGVMHRDKLWEDMREHVNKLDMSYEGLISFFINMKQDSTIPYSVGDFAIFLTRFFVDQPITIIKPVLKKGKMKRDEDHYVYKTFYANEADSLLSSD